MKFDPDKHHRRSIRLRGYDYTKSGAYFVTICTQGKECILGEIKNGMMIKNKFGKIISNSWEEIPVKYPHVNLDISVTMPNHFHGILVIDTTTRRGGVSPPLGQMIAYFKYHSTRQINVITSSPGIRCWQRNYYEHIIRNDEDLNRIRQYITDNPKNWVTDENNPNHP